MFNRNRTAGRAPTLVTTERPMPDQGLALRGIKKAFSTAKGTVTALQGIDLEIKRGEFVSLIGHSGCGKSTLLNIMAGLTGASAGRITLDGAPITKPGPDRGVVFQQYSLLPWLTVRGNVLTAVDSVYPTKTLPDKHTLVDSILHKVGLFEHRDKKPAQISGGMKQRVAIARAFAIQPKVLLLDEPFGALDALTKSALHEELMALWSGDKRTETVVMVTHDIDEAIYFSDRIVVMTNGPEATIGEIIDVPLPRPRHKQGSLHTPAAIAVRERLLHLLTVAYARHL